jgi:hypothetical protein
LPERAPHLNKEANVRLKKRKGKIWSLAPKDGLAPRQAGQLTVGHISDDETSNF